LRAIDQIAEVEKHDSRHVKGGPGAIFSDFSSWKSGKSSLAPLLRFLRCRPGSRLLS